MTDCDVEVQINLSVPVVMVQISQCLDFETDAGITDGPFMDAVFNPDVFPNDYFF